LYPFRRSRAGQWVAASSIRVPYVYVQLRRSGDWQRSGGNDVAEFVAAGAIGACFASGACEVPICIFGLGLVAFNASYSIHQMIADPGSDASPEAMTGSP